MTFSETFRNGKFRFERSGFFGRGDTVIVYKNGVKVDEFEMDDSTLDFLNNPDYSASGKQGTFKMACYDWYADYGCHL